MRVTWPVATHSSACPALRIQSQQRLARQRLEVCGLAGRNESHSWAIPADCNHASLTSESATLSTPLMKKLFGNNLVSRFSYFVSFANCVDMAKYVVEIRGCSTAYTLATKSTSTRSILSPLCTDSVTES